MAQPWTVRRRRRRRAREGSRLDAAARLADRRGHPALPAPERPGTGSRFGSHGVPDHLHRLHPGWHARPDGGGHPGARGRTRAAAGRAGAPAAAVGALRRAARAGPVASPGHSRDAGDPDLASAGCLDECADHATHQPPERPGGRQGLTHTEKALTLLTGSARTGGIRPSDVEALIVTNAGGPDRWCPPPRLCLRAVTLRFGREWSQGAASA